MLNSQLLGPNSAADRRTSFVSEDRRLERSGGSRSGHDLAPPVALLNFLQTGWAERTPATNEPIEGADHYQDRRRRLSEQFPGLSLVIPAGQLVVRSADSKYRFRPSSDFLYLVGEASPNDVLVMDALPGGGHTSLLFSDPDTDPSSPDFFTDRIRGEFWVGPKMGLAEMAARLGIRGAPRATLSSFVNTRTSLAVVRGISPDLDRLDLPPTALDHDLQAALANLRLIKDELEIRYLKEAVDATVAAFDRVVRNLHQMQTERDVETIFCGAARTSGNDVGYPVIAAAGAHATILHWHRNSGQLRSGDLLLLDAGVEAKSFYTASIARTLPIGGRFTRAQRTIYDLVWAAQQEAIVRVRVGNPFYALDDAAQAVLARGLYDLGVLSIPAEQSLAADSHLHRRYTVHGASHMLGLDVHDCAHATPNSYPNGHLAPGMVLTVEPGLYFQANDETVPPEYRGIGARIGDDVLVTEDGPVVLSTALPSARAAVEEWVRTGQTP